MRFLLFIAVLFCGLSAEAANHYIRSLSIGMGNNTGVDWNNPITNWTGLSGTWTYGDTNYFLGGEYRPSRTGLGNWRMDATGATLKMSAMIIATKEDHGTDVGWSDSFTNDVTHICNVSVDTDNWYIDGKVGQWFTNDTNYVAFRLKCHDTNINSGTLSDFFINSNVTNVFIKHMEIYDDNVKGQTNPPYINGYVALYLRSPHDRINLDSVTIHDVAATGIQWDSPNATNRNVCIARTGIGQITMQYTNNEHSEPISMGGANGCTNVVWLNLELQDARSSAWIFFNKAATNTQFIGGSMRATGYWVPGVDVSATTAIFGGNDSALTDFMKVQQMTFVNIPYAGRWGENTNFYGPNNLVENCLFYNVTNIVDGTKMPYGSFGHKDNYYGLSGTYGEVGEQDLDTNPLSSTNAPVDLRLTFDTMIGDASIYPLPFQDIYGNAWTSSRGAIQFAGSPPPPPLTSILRLNVRIFGQ